MSEDQDTATGGSAAQDNPIGEVTIPLRRREIARAQALAGVTLGLTAMFGIMSTLDTSTCMIGGR